MLYDMVKSLKKYEDIYEREEYGVETREEIKKLYKSLKDYPDIYKRVKGAYLIQHYMDEESDLFYIQDMATFKMLLTEKRYSVFLHEMYDFLFFKIMKGTENRKTKLPKNIKDAILYTIRENFPYL